MQAIKHDSEIMEMPGSGCIYMLIDEWKNKDVDVLGSPAKWFCTGTQWINERTVEVHFSLVMYKTEKTEYE